MKKGIVPLGILLGAKKAVINKDYRLYILAY